MCVIAYKKKDVNLPADSTFESMWNDNPDGAGVMWRDNESGKIKFAKGFMKKKKFKRWLNQNRKWLNESECAFHFRITTNGGTSKGNCHPFVCDASVDSHILSGAADCVMMHNGVLPVVPRKASISDSAELALRIGRWEDPVEPMNDIKELFVGNRIIIMSTKGTFFYGDKWEAPLKDGIYYSNNYFVFGDRYFNLRYGGGNNYSPCYTKTDGAVVPSRKTNVHFDNVEYVFCDALGNIVDMDDIDPDCLSVEDFEIFRSCIAQETAYDAILADKAISARMSVNAYAAMIGESYTNDK